MPALDENKKLYLRLAEEILTNKNLALADDLMPLILGNTSAMMLGVSASKVLRRLGYGATRRQGRGARHRPGDASRRIHGYSADGQAHQSQLDRDLPDRRGKIGRALATNRRTRTAPATRRHLDAACELTAWTLHLLLRPPRSSGAARAPDPLRLDRDLRQITGAVDLLGGKLFARHLDVLVDEVDGVLHALW